MKAALAMSPGLPARFFDANLHQKVEQLVEIDMDEVLQAFVQPRDTELLITAWGCPAIGPRELETLPALRAIVHAAGSVKHFLSTDVFDRGITVTTAAQANARPVAEFSLAMILLAGKDAPRLSRQYRRERKEIDLLTQETFIGNFGLVVGIWGASLIGRTVIEMLQNHDVEILLADPTVTVDQARDMGAQLVELETLFERSSVVSLHAPLLPATEHRINAALLARLRQGGTLINTARGALVDHHALRTELRSGRISAILDVTDPEPLPPEDELWSLPNVVLTPHLSGSQGNELHRLGTSATEEIERIVRGHPPLHSFSLAEWATSA